MPQNKNVQRSCKKAKACDRCDRLNLGKPINQIHNMSGVNRRKTCRVEPSCWRDRTQPVQLRKSYVELLVHWWFRGCKAEPVGSRSSPHPSGASYTWILGHRLDDWTWTMGSRCERTMAQPELLLESRHCHHHCKREHSIVKSNRAWTFDAVLQNNCERSTPHVFLKMILPTSVSPNIESHHRGQESWSNKLPTIFHKVVSLHRNLWHNKILQHVSWFQALNSRPNLSIFQDLPRSSEIFQDSQLGNSDCRDAEHESLLCLFKQRCHWCQCCSRLWCRDLQDTRLRKSWCVVATPNPKSVRTCQNQTAELCQVTPRAMIKASLHILWISIRWRPAISTNKPFLTLLKSTGAPKSSKIYWKDWNIRCFKKEWRKRTSRSSRAQMCTSSWSSFTPSIDDSLCWHPELETNREAVCIIQHLVELIVPSRSRTVRTVRTVRTIRTVRIQYGNWQIHYGNRTARLIKTSVSWNISKIATPSDINTQAWKQLIDLSTEV